MKKTSVIFFLFFFLLSACSSFFYGANAHKKLLIDLNDDGIKETLIPKSCSRAGCNYVIMHDSRNIGEVELKNCAFKLSDLNDGFRAIIYYRKQSKNTYLLGIYEYENGQYRFVEAIEFSFPVSGSKFPDFICADSELIN